MREHAAWALGRIGGEQAIAALQAALDHEEDSKVVEEIELVLQELGVTALSR